MSAIEAITVPKWGLTMTEGTVNEWLVEEGATIRVGDALMDMETSKIVNTVESIVAGTLRRIVAQPGATLLIGDLLGVVADNDTADADIDDFIANFKIDGVAKTDALGSGAETVATPPPTAPDIAQPAAATAPAQPSALTALGEGEDDSAVAASNHARRLAVQYGVNLNNVTASGRHGRVSRANVVAALTEAGVELEEANSATSDLPEAMASTADDSQVKATPVARRLARELGINLHQCRPTGRHGRVCKYDVEAANALLNGAAAPVAPTPELAQDNQPAVQAVPMSGMRRTIAARLQSSKQNIPHYRVSTDVRLDNLMALRKQINEADPGVNISVNDGIVKAVAMALGKMPQLNVQFDEDNQSVLKLRDVDISVAVAIDDGLITPIVKSANTKTLTEISQQVRELATRAKAGTLQPDEFQGGSFTISNLGMYGVKHFDAIINPPQCAILAVGAGQQRPTVIDGELVVATEMTLTLSSDHRVIDGAIAAQFLQLLKRSIENPSLMLA